MIRITIIINKLNQQYIHSLFIVTHSWEPCQAKAHSLTFINIRAWLSYNDTKKWLENNFTSTLHINFTGGWARHLTRWPMAKQKLKPYTSHVTWNPPYTCAQTPCREQKKQFPLLLFFTQQKNTLIVKAPNCSW